MRIAMMAAAMATMAATAGRIQAHAQALPAAPDRKVTVCFAHDAGVPFDVIGRAEAAASLIYRQIGVSLEWRSTRCPGGSIQIGLQFVTPRTDHPGAFAYALPYEGTHIVVFYDRVAATARDHQSTASLLGHVMAHEIGHILEGIDRHSESGLMKANWSADEIQLMRVRPMVFSGMDAEMIYHGLESRSRALADAR